MAPDPGGPLILGAEECVDALWLRPLDAPDRHASGSLRLVPPTWVARHGLAGQATGGEIVARARRRRPDVFTSRAGTTVNGSHRVLRGDVAAEDHAVAKMEGGRHRLAMGALPQVYQRFAL